MSELEEFLNERNCRKVLDKYIVCDNGDIYSTRFVSRRTSYDRLKKLKANPQSGGYLSVGLSQNNKRKTYAIHVLVLEAFCGPRPPGLFACHRDGNKTNNHVSNLYWGTPKQNTADRIAHGTDQRGEKNHNAKMNDEMVKEIWRLKADNIKQRTIAARLGITEFDVNRIVRRKAWKHLAPSEIIEGKV